MRQLLGAAPALLATPWVQGQQGLREVRLATPGPLSTLSLPAESLVGAGRDVAAGFRLRVTVTSGGVLALRQLADRNVDLAVAGFPAGMLMRADGAPIVAVAALETRPHYALVVRKEVSPQIRSVAALRGRSIGVHNNAIQAKSTSRLLLELVLRNAGVSPDQVRFVAVGQNWETQASALRSGAVDALLGDEAFSDRLVQTLGATVLMDLRDPVQTAAVPGAGFLRSTLFTRQEVVDRDPELLSRVVPAFARQLAWLNDQTPTRIAEVLGVPAGPERDALVGWLGEGQLFPRDARFSTAQLRETDVFVRASAGPQPPAGLRALTADSMVVDRWAGRRD